MGQAPVSHTVTGRGFCRAAFVVLLHILAIVAVTPGYATASLPINHLYRIEILPEKDFTRITIRFADSPNYQLSAIPGNRLRVVMRGTSGTLFKKFRRYSDKNIGGLVLKTRGNDLLVTFQIARSAGWRDLSRSDVTAITVDVGAPFKPGVPHPSLAGREKIWNGVEKLVRDFDPPLKSEIPFTPTDRQILANFLGEEEQKQFMAAESALYKGQLTEAETLFTQFSTRSAPIRALALYRLAEVWYKLQKYPQALATFREAEKLWPAYLNLNPGVTFYYGDSIARSGELATARTLLASLVARLADKAFSPALLVRLGDIMARQGHEPEARALYRNVAENFKTHKACQMALMRVADSEFLQTTPWNYRSVSDVYLNASLHSGDLDMREEAHFKYVLLESMHGEAGGALQQVMSFQRKFPRGVYVAVIRTIREVLVAEVFRKTDWKNDASALVRFMDEQHEYLTGCVEQPGFLATLSRAYTEAGRPIELVRLLSALVDRVWAAPIAPELYLCIIDNAELIGDTATTERMMKAFISRFPAHQQTRMITERLGGFYFAADKHQQVKGALLWLLNKGEHAQRADSYYKLGRSLWSLQQYGQAAKAMDLFLLTATGRNPQLLPDAYFIDGSSRESAGDQKGALRIYEAALKLADNPRSEEFIYRAAQSNLKEKKSARARVLFGQLAKNGKDADWQKLAQQALADMDAKPPSR